MANVGDILDQITATFKSVGYQAVYVGEHPTQTKLDRFVVFIMDDIVHNPPQSKNGIATITIRQYKKLANSVAQKAIRAQYQSATTSDKTNVYRLFQFNDTRVQLPNSAQMWFDQSTNEIVEIGNDRFILTETIGNLSIIEE